jgi:hypothetical protein
MPDSLRVDKQLLVAALGITSSLLTGIILALIEVSTGFAIYSWTLWFIIPVGAFLAGFGGASGYYAGAKLFQQKPAGGVLFNMMLASISTFFLVYYIPYYMLEADGIRIKDAISFWQYLDFSFTHTSLRLLRGSASTGELGSLGYVHAVLQLIGFSLGGIGVFGWLLDNPYCDKCSRYLTKTGRRDRYYLGQESFVQDMEQFSALIESQRLPEAVRFHNDEMGIPQEGTKPLRTRLSTHSCLKCGINHLDFIVSRRTKDEWKDINGTRIVLFTQEQLLPESGFKATKGSEVFT